MITDIKTALLGTGTQSESMGVGYNEITFPPETPHDVDEGEQDHLTIDEIFDTLGNQRRRYVLTYLSATDGTATVSDLAERITAWECGKDVEDITAKERKRVYVSLYQGHLPKLADVGAISYDRDGGNIETGDTFEQFIDSLRGAT